MRIFLFVLACTTALLPLAQNGALAQESNARNTTEAAWEVTRELLQRREYSIAIYFLESLADDPAYAEKAEIIQADIKAISGLKEFSDSVENGIKSLTAGDEFSDRNNNFIFQRYEENHESNSLLVKAKSGEERPLKQRRLHSLTWLDLASRNENHVPDSLTVGLFLAFDKDADSEAARAKLDEAAQSGQDVKLWLERASGVVEQKTVEQVPQTSTEPLVGNWFLITGKRKIAFIVKFFGNGQGNDLVKEWKKSDDGYYRVEFSRTGTASVIVIGDKLFGRLSTGQLVRGWR